MLENNRKSQRYILQIGAAFAVTAAIPLSSIAADAATTADKLSALRAAVASGQLELRLGTADGASAADRLRLAQGFENAFDNSAPQNPPPENAPSLNPTK
jgi:uncharacterized membrane protein